MGPIEKRPDSIDRRKVNIAFSPKGEEEIQKIEKVLLDLIHEQISNLSDDELKKLAESFDNIVAVFSK